MKVSGTISFIVMLLLGLVTLFLGMNMEVVLKSSSSLIINSIIILLLAIVIFVISLKERYTVMKWVGIITIVISLILFLMLMNSMGNDYDIHRELLDSRDVFVQVGFISLIATIILGAVNTALAFRKK